MSSSVFRRPGVSDKFLEKAGCAHVGESDCLKAFGCRAEGIAIPFRLLDGQPIVDNGKQFARIRLGIEVADQKPWPLPRGPRQQRCDLALTLGLVLLVR